MSYAYGSTASKPSDGSHFPPYSLMSWIFTPNPGPAGRTRAEPKSIRKISRFEILKPPNETSLLAQTVFSVEISCWATGSEPRVVTYENVHTHNEGYVMFMHKLDCLSCKKQ